MILIGGCLVVVKFTVLAVMFHGLPRDYIYIAFIVGLVICVRTALSRKVRDKG